GWVNLGRPLAAPGQAYQVRFSSLTTGWLATSGSAPYAYRSEDLGDSWSPVALPSPRGAWPASGQFFVGVQPTSGGGALASIVYFPPVKGRSGVAAGSLPRPTAGGVSWTDPQSIGAVEPLPGSLQLLDGAHAWLAASVGSRPVLESTDDAGLHWRIVLLPAVADSPQALT